MKYAARNMGYVDKQPWRMQGQFSGFIQAVKEAPPG